MRSSGSFLSGLLIGVLTSLGIVILFSLDFHPSAWFSKKPDAAESADTIVDLSRKPQAPYSREKNLVTENKQVEFAAIDTTLAFEVDSLPNIKVSSNPEKTYTDEIVVMRDELLRTVFIDAVPLNKSTNTKSDSLIQTLQGGSPGKPGNYRVEFWRSPVNFKGYRLLRTSVITFGLDPDESLKLYELNNTIYLRSGNMVYRLQLTDKFLPFQKVTDDSLLKQLRS